jgi:hypothetical protein
MYQPYPGHETQLPQTQRPPAPASVLTAVKAMYAGAWLAGLVAVVFLWRRTSSAYFRPAPA